MKKKILATIKKYELLPKGSDIVFGLSGGPDSLALFDVLVLESEKYDWTIYPVHINHKFRPGAAEEDQAFVEDLCFRLYHETDGRIRPCSSFVVDCNKIAELNHMTSEEAGRAVRYESFVNVASKLDNPIIVVAQNANDQAETVLFRIIRGTSVDGLSGIAYRRFEEGIPVVRPLMDCTRDEIEKYCEERKLNPRRDLTNDEPLYTRNKIRLELIPKLMEINPNIFTSINRLAESASYDKAYLYEEARKAYEEFILEKGEEIKLDNSKLKNLHQAIRYRVYNLAVSEIGMKENMARVYLNAIEKISLSRNGKAYTELNGGYRVRRETNKLVFYKEKN